MFTAEAAAGFLLVLMVCHLMYMAVGTGKFVEEFLPFPRWQSTLIVFGVVGVYVTLGGFFGVILTDFCQTVLISIGAIILTVLAFQVDGARLRGAQARGVERAHAYLEALVELRGNDPAGVPALPGVRTDYDLRVYLDDFPFTGGAERVGFPIFP